MDDARVPGFGAVLKRLRRNAGFSQEALAERAGISVQAISALECGLRKSPYPKTIALLAEALGLDAAARSGLEAAAAESKAERTARDNLPQALTRLVGRGSELGEIQSMLKGGRFVTVTGTGGIGKTSIALEVARTIRGEFADGTWFCDLAPLTDGSLIATTIAASRGLSLRPNEQSETALGSALRSSSMLLLLDNCEHVVEGAASVAAALLRVCPGVKILATSRRRLGIKSEATYSMQPLAVPDEASIASLTAEQAQAFGAIALFVQRAGAANSAFVLSDHNAPDVARICRRLDGVALALELGAAQLRAMNVGDLARRIDQRFRLLRDARRDDAPRHRTLRAAFDWSYELLSEQEARFFRALGIFAGSFRLEAALGICCEDGVDELHVLELLAALVDASLLVADSGGSRTRYRLLETTRAYALERLVEHGERAALAVRHLRHYSVFGADLDLPNELEDVRAALHWALDGGDAGAGASLAAAVGVHWEKLGIAAEGIARLESFIAAVPGDDALLAARLWAALSFLFGNVLRFEAGFEAAEQAVAHARQAGDEPVLFNALRSYAIFAAWQKRFAQAESALAEAAALAEAVPSTQRQLYLFFARGHIGRARGDHGDAAAAFDAARTLARSLDDPYREVSATVHLAEVEHERGRTTHSVALLRELRADRALNVIDDEAVLANLAGYLAAVDDLAGVRSSVRELLKRHQRTPASSMFVSAAIEHLALADALDGRFARAARLLGYASAYYRETGATRQFTEQRTHERLTATLGEHLAPSEYEALVVEGATLTAGRAAREALRED